MKNTIRLCVGLVALLVGVVTQAQNTAVLAAISATHASSSKQELVTLSESPGMVLAKFAVNHTERSGGAGSRVIDGLYIDIADGQKIETSNLPEIEIDHSPNDSYLFIRGTIHAGGREYHAVAPKLTYLDQQLRENAPEECGIYFVGDIQLKSENHFLVKYLFEDTINKGICWDYFLSLKSFSFSTDVVSLIEYNLQFRSPEIEAEDSGPFRVQVGPLIPHLTP